MASDGVAGSGPMLAQGADLGGSLLGPFMPLVLYLYLILKAKREGQPGSRLV